MSWAVAILGYAVLVYEVYTRAVPIAFGVFVAVVLIAFYIAAKFLGAFNSDNGW